MMQPKTISDEVVKRMNALIDESDRFRDWDSHVIQDLVDSLEMLKKADNSLAYIHLASVAAICGDLERMDDFYTKAALELDEFTVKPEYWISLANAGLYARAYELGQWLLDPKKGFIKKIWERAVSFGHIIEVWDQLAAAKKTYPELGKCDLSRLEEVVSVMKERELSDHDIVSVLDLVGKVQRAHRIMFSGNLVASYRVIRSPEDPPYVYGTMMIKADPQEIHAMNRELVRLVAETMGAFPRGLVFSFVKAHQIELRAAA